MAIVAAAPGSLQRATFALAGRTLAISTEDAAISHILSTTYENARTVNNRVVHHQAALQRLGDGRLHVRFDRKAVPVGDAGVSVPMLCEYYAVKEVFARFAAAAPKSVAFYGAAVAVDGSAVLILGPTTIGKTLFALHLAWQGATFLGDETALLDMATCTVNALARKPSLRETALEFLPATIRDRVEAGNHAFRTERGRFWYALTPFQLSGVAPLDRAFELRAVCVIRERASDFVMRRVQIVDMLPTLLQRAYTRPSQLAQISKLRHSLRGVAQFELTLSHPADSAAAFLRGLAACG